MDSIDTMMVSVRADTGAFAQDVAAMRASLAGGLGGGADVAGRAIETALGRAVRSGKFGFDELKKVALSVLAEIAAATVKQGIGAVLGGSGGGGPGLLGLAATLLGGQPGRATGGPVSPGRAYRVGERGPELFVPTSSGAIAPAAAAPARAVNVAITVQAGSGDGAAALARSSRQVARAVRAALAGA